MSLDIATEEARRAARERAYTMPLAEISPADPALFQADLHWPYFERLRAEDPIHFAKSDIVGPYWSVTRYDDILAMDSDFANFSSTVAQPKPNPPDDLLMSMVYSMFIRKDPPAHERQRRAVMPFLTPQNLATFEPTLSARTQEILDSIPVGESEDWSQRLGTDMAVAMLATLFDFPWKDRHRLLFWTQVAIGFTTGRPMAKTSEGRWIETEAETRRELADMMDYFLTARAERRKAPMRSDAISMLAHHEAARDLSPSDYLGCVLMLLIGGKDSTKDTVLGAVHALAQHPEEYQKLRARRDLIPNMVAESLRWQTPVAFQIRRATRDIEIHGKSIAKDDALWLWYVSGNRDAGTIEDPDVFNIERARARQHLSFGFGIHRCPGNRLAELQLRTMWDGILDRFATLELAGRPKLIESCFVRGFTFLPIRAVQAPSTVPRTVPA